MIASNNNTSSAAATPNFRVGDERLIKLTPGAAKKVGSLLTKQGRPGGVLRVAVIGGGCSGLQYKMDLQDKPANRDFLVETAGVKVVVDPSVIGGVVATVGDTIFDGSVRTRIDQLKSRL